ncbi:hypothetical protein L484_006710 [Morus notabilis]|uniref:Uncharacterized protein n=1 Tax=Morus notabilis TaxID=981085 RepID=W9RQA7_9ROSA|nr:hypothetical protein L484_006710 [Morus notabilis]
MIIYDDLKIICDDIMLSRRPSRHPAPAKPAQLTQPYCDCANEGSLSIFTEFSPMADPSFQPGHPSQAVVELGRVVDRGLR